MKRVCRFMVLIVLIITFPSSCQEGMDIIYLDNGEIVKGSIIENVPGDYLKIELPETSIFTYKYSEILCFTFFPKEKSSNKLQEKLSTDFRQNQKLSSTQQISEYERNKKSPGSAVLYSILLPSAGHAYANNWSRGLLFAAGRIGGITLALTQGFKRKVYLYENSGNNYRTEKGPIEITTWFYVGIGLNLALTVWEAINASSETERYNQKLYDKKTGKNFGLDILPVKSGVQFRLSYNF